MQQMEMETDQMPSPLDPSADPAMKEMEVMEVMETGSGSWKEMEMETETEMESGSRKEMEMEMEMGTEMMASEAVAANT